MNQVHEKDKRLGQDIVYYSEMLLLRSNYMKSINRTFQARAMTPSVLQLLSRMMSKWLISTEKWQNESTKTCTTILEFLISKHVVIM